MLRYQPEETVEQGRSSCTRHEHPLNDGARLFQDVHPGFGKKLVSGVVVPKSNPVTDVLLLSLLRWMHLSRRSSSEDMLALKCC